MASSLDVITSNELQGPGAGVLRHDAAEMDIARARWRAAGAGKRLGDSAAFSHPFLAVARAFALSAVSCAFFAVFMSRTAALPAGAFMPCSCWRPSRIWERWHSKTTILIGRTPGV